MVHLLELKALSFDVSLLYFTLVWLSYIFLRQEICHEKNTE